MTDVLPYPATLDAGVLLDVLSLRTNPKLRRELCTPLGQAAGQDWPSSKDETEWAKALLDLLARPDGPSLYGRATELHNRGPLGPDHKLNLSRAVHRFAIRDERRSCARAEPAATIRALLDAGATPQAALLAWATTLFDPTSRDAVGEVVAESEEIRAALGLPPGANAPGIAAPAGGLPATEPLGTAGMLIRLRAAAAALASSEQPGIAALEALAELATDLAAALRRTEAEAAKAREALLQRLAASQLDLGQVHLPQHLPLSDIVAALDLAEETAREAEEAERKFREAASTPGSLSYDLIAEKMSAAKRARDAAKYARAALLERLPGSPYQEPPPGAGQPAAPPEREPAGQEAAPPAPDPAEEQPGTADAAPTPPQPQAPPEKAPSPVAETATPEPVEAKSDEAKPARSQPDPTHPAPTQPTASHPTLPEPIVADEPPAEVVAPEPSPEAQQTPPSAAPIQTTPEDGPGRKALLRAVAETRLGLAHALVVAGAVPPHAALLTPAIRLAATAMATHEATDPGDVSVAVEALRNAWDSRAGSDLATTAWLLALPAAGLMLVLAPGGNPACLVDTLLRTPPDRMPNTLALARALSENAAQLSVLSQVPDALQRAVSDDERRQKLIEHGEALRAWMERNREPHLNNYTPARDVWSRMLHPDQPLGAMLAIACANAANRAAELAEDLDRFDAQKELERQDIALRGAKLVQSRPIAYGARRDLVNLLEEAERQLHDWVRVARGAASAEQRGMAHALRDMLLPMIRAAAEEVGAIAAEPAAPAAKAILARLEHLLANGVWPGGCGGADQLLARDILQVPGIGLGPGWRMSVQAGPDMLAHLVAAAEAPLQIGEAIRYRIGAGDLAEAAMALGLVDDEETRAVLDRDIRDAAAARHQSMVKGLAEARTEVEAAEGEGRLDYGLAQRFLMQVDDLEALLRIAVPKDIPLLDADFAALRDAIRAELAKASAQQRARILQRMGSLNLTVQASIRPEVTRLIDQGWLPNAEDLIDRAESGEHADMSADHGEPAHGFADFFPARSERIARALRLHRPGIMGFAEQAPDLPEELVMPPAAREAGQCLTRAWVACAPGRSLPTAFATLFAELGFREARVDGITPMTGGATRLTLRTQPLRDRDTTLLPDFGSVADGTYPVIALGNQPELRQVRGALQQMGGTTRATFVLYFGVLSNHDRRELARMAAVGQLGSAIVLDHVLLSHLAITEEDRLRTLFACTLPFSGLAPWSAIGTPPPEMFFGRYDERQGIEARSGRISHLVYGGRQLGKTALLRQIEGAAAGDARRLVRYVDIKSFGTNQPTAEIWPALAEALRPAVPMAADRGGDPGARFVRDVTSWLEGNADRSILMLLDEADRFFREDKANGYRVTEQLRGLAERTNRRFKPVFAGLENVQRMARDPNNPIAQLGQPLLIGPLLRRGERRAAEALVRWPFEALGFTLARPVVNRILVFANYYPSLIQLVCESLLRELRARQAGPPPWAIEMADVENLLARPDMRRAAFDKFRITLELDPRYDLLALAAAARNQDEALTLATGISASRLREDAAAFWPAGFANLDEEAFDALLDQMVGLGVLRATDLHRYALRSANLIHLIGSPKTIGDQLLAFHDRPAPNDPDPLEHRRSVDDAPSVLTSRQEADLLGLNTGDGIVVCLGLALGGTPDGDGTRVGKAIRQTVLALPPTARPAMPSLRAADAAGFRRELGALARGDAEKSQLVMVTPKHPWTPDWIREAAAVLEARAAGRGTLRVVFVADARRGWLWAEEAPVRESLLSRGAADRRMVVEIVPGLWNRQSIDVWMTMYDPSLTLPDWLLSDRATLLGATGGWDWALRCLMEQGRAGMARTGAADLSARLLETDSGKAAIRELAALPGMAALVAAVDDAHSLKSEGELVTPDFLADFVGHRLAGLAWAQAVELVIPGALGLELNALLRAARPMLRAASG